MHSITGEGLAEAFAGTRVAVDIANSPAGRDETSPDLSVIVADQVVAAAAAAGIGHYVALSVLGARYLASGDRRATKAQETVLRSAGLPYTLLHSALFFESIEELIEDRSGDAVHVPRATARPVACEDVVAALAEVALSAPLNGVLELTGPETIPLDEVARLVLSARETPAKIVTDFGLGVFDVEPEGPSPAPEWRTGPTRLSDWLRDLISPG